MSSFFVSSDKVKVGQSSISIPSENGLSYAPGGKIDLYIPPTSKFVDLSQSRLQMRVKLQVPTTIGVQRLQWRRFLAMTFTLLFALITKLIRIW